MYVKTKHTGIRKVIPRGTSSQQFCEEKHSCNSDRTKASCFCVDCGSHQCADCRGEIHQSPTRNHHNIQPIIPATKEKLCQNEECSDVNYATVTCLNCHLNLCNQCFAILHMSVKKQSHRKRKFVYIGPQQLLTKNVSAINNLDIKSETLSFVTDSNEYHSLNSDLNGIGNMNHEEINIDTHHFHGSKHEPCDSGQRSHHSDLDLNNSEDFYGASESIQLDQSIASQVDERNKKLLSFLLIDQDEVIQVGDYQRYIHFIIC